MRDESLSHDHVSPHKRRWSLLSIIGGLVVLVVIVIVIYFAWVGWRSKGKPVPEIDTQRMAEPR